MRELDRTIDYLLKKLDPYPAIVVDRRWDILRMNASAGRFLPMLLPPGAPVEIAANIVLSILDPRGARPFIVNWGEVVISIVERARLELAREVEDGDERRAFCAALLAYPGVKEAMRSPFATRPALPFLPVHFRREEIEARFFTMLTTIGTPLDVTAEELRVEAYFPADDATKALMEAMASGAIEDEVTRSRRAPRIGRRSR